MRVVYDKGAGALYISLRRAKIKRTIEVAEGVLADLDGKENLCGFEILGVFREPQMRKRKIKKAPASRQ